MTAKNIRLSIVLLFLCSINALFYYFFNQIAFLINYTSRTYTERHYERTDLTPPAIQSTENPPVLTADVYNLLFPKFQVPSDPTAATLALSANTIENTQVSTLNDSNAFKINNQVNTAPVSSLAVVAKKKNSLTNDIQIIQTPASAQNTAPVATIVPPQPVVAANNPDESDESADAPAPAKDGIGHMNGADIKNFIASKSISTDNSVAGKMVSVNGQASLMVYPTNTDWQEMFVIFNLNASDKTPLKSIVTPDFAGVVYPSMRKGELDVNGTNYKVTLVKLKGHAPSESYPYFLYLTNTNTFFIFGDYADKNKWYIYENNKVNHYVPSSDLHLF